MLPRNTRAEASRKRGNGSASERCWSTTAHVPSSYKARNQVARPAQPNNPFRSRLACGYIKEHTHPPGREPILGKSDPPLSSTTLLLPSRPASERGARMEAGRESSKAKRARAAMVGYRLRESPPPSSVPIAWSRRDPLRIVCCPLGFLRSAVTFGCCCCFAF